MSGLYFRALGRDGGPPRITRFFVGVLFAQVLAACGGDSPPPPAASLPSAPVDAGRYGPYFFGGVQIGTEDYYGEALLARDGTARLFIAGPYGSTARVSAQFVGRIEVRSDQVTGTGTIIGQGCANPEVNPYCRRTVIGEISGTFTSSGLRAEVRVTNDEGVEVWVLDFSRHDLFTNDVAMETLAGQYIELLAEFARDGDTIVNIDHEGRLFFQSPGSGCVGNGALVERPDGSFNLYDITLTIEACNQPYAYLNGEFEGVASPAADGWDYGGFLLQILLSRPAGAPSQAAITMSGRTDF